LKTAETMLVSHANPANPEDKESTQIKPTKADLSEIIA
jgi:hypothetical protein